MSLPIQVATYSPAAESVPAVCHSHSLAELMTIPPNLHAEVLVQKRVTTVQCLRLVSKEIGRLGITAVRSCKVFIGEGDDSPSAEQLVRLMAGKAVGIELQLQELEIIITVATGEACHVDVFVHDSGIVEDATVCLDKRGGVAWWRQQFEGLTCKRMSCIQASCTLCPEFGFLATDELIGMLSEKS